MKKCVLIMCSALAVVLAVGIIALIALYTANMIKESQGHSVSVDISNPGNEFKGESFTEEYPPVDQQSSHKPLTAIDMTTKKPEKSSCDDIVPGLNKLSRGIDITTVDLVPTDLSGSHGYKQPVIDFTCDDQKKWVQNEHAYDQPDEIAVISSFPGGRFSTQVGIYKNFNEMKRDLSVSVGVSGSFMFGMFSSSSSYKKLQHSIVNSSQFIERVSAFDSSRRADLLPYWALELAYQPQQLVNRLPPMFESAVASYNEFIKFYGTHFFQSARYGGVISMLIETSSDYYLNKTDTQVEMQASAVFGRVFQANGSYKGSKTGIDKAFESSSSTDIKYYGGSSNILSKSGIIGWQPTVAKNPWLFSGELLPITHLIRDSTRKSSMERAINNYIHRALLQEYERLLIAATITYHEEYNTLQILLSEVRNALTLDILPIVEVERLKGDLDTQLMIPDWFRTSTSLCLRWYSDGDVTQCGGVAKDKLCAKPGQKTSWYRDDSDKRLGGCLMSWGLISDPGQFDSWFQKVQLCFRWHAEDDGHQCGRRANGNYCSDVGTYTEYYRDDTDSRSGGCYLSWKLEVPNEAPIWMKNVQLCLQWKGQSRNGRSQCNRGRENRNLCAVANSWTAYYHDDTDKREEGCLLSWGLSLP